MSDWKTRAKELSQAAWDVVKEENGGKIILNMDKPQDRLSATILELAEHLSKAGEEIASLRARLAEAARSEETLRRCTICGFVVDTKWKAEFPAPPQPTSEVQMNKRGEPSHLDRNDTLQEYFERNEQAGIIDFSLRILRTPEGKLDFYIHPQSANGETGDFTVSGGFVSKLIVAAGSSRPLSPPLLGSEAKPSGKGGE